MTTTASPRQAPAHRAVRPRGWLPLHPSDQSWCGIHYTRALLDLEVPPFAQMRRALGVLASCEPMVGQWLRENGTPGRRPVTADERDAWVDLVIVESTEAGVDKERAFELCDLPLDISYGVPFRLVVGPDWIGLRMSHVMGDGFTVNTLIDHLMRQAATTDLVPLPWTVVSPAARDRLVAREALRHITSLPSVLRERDRLAGGRYEPLERRAGGHADRSIAFASSIEFSRDLRAVRDDWFPKASATTVAMVGLRAAFATTLPEPRPGFECLFNTRTEDTATAWGNWSVGVWLYPSDDYSPTATTEAIADARRRGLPQIATVSLRARARRSNSEAVAVLAPEGRPRLTLSYVQKHATEGMYPGLRIGGTELATITRPNGLDTITVQVVELAGRVNASVSFYPDAWPEADVRRAMQLFLDSPRRCLERARRAEEAR